jgi:F-type H+-transporting ATPase subunit beta
VDIADTIAGCRAILDGEGDGWPESMFYMAGGLDEIRERNRRAGGEPA